MSMSERPHIVEHRLFGPMPRWSRSWFMRLFNSLISISMLLGGIVFFSLGWSDPWLPAWAYVVAVSAVFFGAVYTTAFFLSLMVFQWSVTKMRRH